MLIIGSGPIVIGQACEFDYSGTQACKALRELGYEIVLVNSNPATIMTDPGMADRTYIEPLTLAVLEEIIARERPDTLLPNLGGQTGLNLSAELSRTGVLARYGVRIVGVQADAIERGEDRVAFKETMNKLGIEMPRSAPALTVEAAKKIAAGVRILGTSPDAIDLAEDRDRFRGIMRELGIPQPESGMAANLEEALAVAARIGYPLMLRPSYVLGGRGMQVVLDEEMLRQYVLAAVDVTPERPILIDKFLENAIEAEADAIADGTDAFVPAVMEHIELAGIHSGDSACVIPPISIPPLHLETIRDYTRKIAIALNVVGLMNIQYAIAGDVVYVLEANPRGSRTVPLVSKICDIPMAKLATKVMLGKKLGELGLKTRSLPHFGVKEAVFPFNMFPEVDPVLGPEMRSTGEVLGLAHSFGLAFFKAQEAAQQRLPTAGRVLITVADRDKGAVLPAARELAARGFEILATGGTHAFLARNGVAAASVAKLHQDRPDVVDAIKNGEVQLVINTPGGKRGKAADAYIRQAAIKHKIPYVTTTAAARAAAMGIAAQRTAGEGVQSLQEYHAGIR